MAEFYPDCANCFLLCAAKPDNEKVECAKACGPSSSRPAPTTPPTRPPRTAAPGTRAPSKAAASSTSASTACGAGGAGGHRRRGDPPCTAQQVHEVGTAENAVAMVMGMMGTFPACANCFMGCASKTGEEQKACGRLCAPPEAAGAAHGDTSAVSVCKPVKPSTPAPKECKDSPDAVVQAVSSMPCRSLLAAPDSVPPPVLPTILACCHAPPPVLPTTLACFDADGMLMSCPSAKNFCEADPRVPVGCPLTCGICKPPECKDSADEVVQAVSGRCPLVAFPLCHQPDIMPPWDTRALPSRRLSCCCRLCSRRPSELLCCQELL